MKAWYLSLNPPSALDTHLLEKAKRERGSVSRIAGWRCLADQFVRGLDETLRQSIGEHLRADDPRRVEPSGISKFPVPAYANRQNSARSPPPLEPCISIRFKGDFWHTQGTGKCRQYFFRPQHGEPVCGCCTVAIPIRFGTIMESVGQGDLTLALDTALFRAPRAALDLRRYREHRQRFLTSSAIRGPLRYTTGRHEYALRVWRHLNLLIVAEVRLPKKTRFFASRILGSWR